MIYKFNATPRPEKGKKYFGFEFNLVSGFVIHYGELTVDENENCIRKAYSKFPQQDDWYHECYELQVDIPYQWFGRAETTSRFACELPVICDTAGELRDLIAEKKQDILSLVDDTFKIADEQLRNWNPNPTALSQ